MTSWLQSKPRQHRSTTSRRSVALRSLRRRRATDRCCWKIPRFGTDAVHRAEASERSGVVHLMDGRHHITSLQVRRRPDPRSARRHAPTPRWRAVVVLCPSCERRCANLYTSKPLDPDYACRRCWDLAYRSQSRCRPHDFGLMHRSSWPSNRNRVHKLERTPWQTPRKHSGNSSGPERNEQRGRVSRTCQNLSSLTRVSRPELSCQTARLVLAVESDRPPSASSEWA